MVSDEDAPYAMGPKAAPPSREIRVADLMAEGPVVPDAPPAPPSPANSHHGAPGTATDFDFLKSVLGDRWRQDKTRGPLHIS